MLVKLLGYEAFKKIIGEAPNLRPGFLNAHLSIYINNKIVKHKIICFEWLILYIKFSHWGDESLQIKIPADALFIPQNVYLL